ncbi:hypothetical protein [Clostridium isatidis]|uniref:Uncharacterized protein n=1 Tax=Clostridium isatidis TaxID=182773 RepID=A0A343JEE7_9CLOT|nr:hypothetical protein [Clostridium isatidis]ASW43905.1 hypothetical protein BEN51_10540 [Clostridium isatidis]
MAKNIYGGGKQTNINGLKFEQETDLQDALSNVPGYEIINNVIYYNGEYIGMLAKKHDLYKLILNPRGINYKEYISKQLLPDEALFLEKTNTIFIIEKKFQNVGGSVDEKLQTFGFKIYQYSKLFDPLKIKVKYFYLLNDWFKKPQYKDILDYMEINGCKYFFNEIPLNFLELPN